MAQLTSSTSNRTKMARKLDLEDGIKKLMPVIELSKYIKQLDTPRFNAGD
jgi:hypothetical protein